MSFFTGNNYCNKCGKPLGIFEQGLCVECEKAEQEPCENDGWIDDEYGRSIRLEQNKTEVIPPLEPCDDAVSRQAVLDCATLITSISTDDWDIGDWVCLFRDRVSQLPPVRPKEPKTGHWIEHNTGHSRYYSCSKCSCLAPNTEVADGVIWKLSKYCPDCGAKMVEPQESEDKEVRACEK